MHWTIDVDTREKKPRLRPIPTPQSIFLLDPKALPTKRVGVAHTLSFNRIRMPTADYGVRGYHGLCLVERKGRLSELARNVLTREGRRKFIAECERLRASCKRPVLLIEGSLSTHLQDRKFGCDPWLAVDAYQRICVEYGIEIVHAPLPTLTVGEYIARLLINTVITFNGV